MLNLICLQIFIQKYVILWSVEKDKSCVNNKWYYSHIPFFFAQTTYGYILTQNFTDAQDTT
jgi:hypothetical protein